MMPSICKPENAACVDDINLKNQQGREVDTTWKQVKPGELEVQVPLKNESAGPATLLVKQFGLAEPDKIALQTYSEAGHLDEFRINAGDREGTLKGTRLDEVTGLDVKGVHFTPLALSRAEGRDELRLQAPDTAVGTFQPGESVGAHVVVKDGRTLELKTSVDQPRPKVTLVSKNVEPGPTAEAVHLGSENELPQDGKLSFFLKTEVPAAFPRNEKIEVSTEDGSLTTLLGLDDGSLVLEDSQSVLAQLDPMKSFGASAFGPLRFRPVHADGRKGDWQPLATLVRVPFLTDVHCTAAPGEAMHLERHQSLPDRLGSRQRRLQRRRLGASGHHHRQRHRAAPHRGGPLHQAARRSQRGKHRNAAGDSKVGHDYVICTQREDPRPQQLATDLHG